MHNCFLFSFQQPEPSPSANRRILSFFDRNFVYYLFEHELFRIGDKPIQAIDIFIFAVAFLVFIYLSNLLRRYFVNRLLARANFRAETTQLAGIIAQYSMIFLGFVITLQIIGIDLTSLNLVAGAIGVAIGFGLQTIASNFVSGLIIVFENPFQVGDRIEIGTITGKVTEIGGRSTKILADDETIHIVPNQKLITENVRSFRRPGEYVPHEIKIYAAYGSDPHQVLEILRATAEKLQILTEPKPSARLKALDVNKLDFLLSVYTAKEMKETEIFLSDLQIEIYQELVKNNIAPTTPIAANVSLEENQ